MRFKELILVSLCITMLSASCDTKEEPITEEPPVENPSDAPEPEDPENPEQPEVTLQPKKVSLWISTSVNFSRLKSKSSIKHFMDLIEGAGFNEIIVEVKTMQGKALYFSDILDYQTTANGVTVERDWDYEDYAQIENGVGMITSLKTEFDTELEFLDEYLANYHPPRRVSVCTGVAAYPTLKALAAKLEAQVDGLEIHVYEIVNHFFGETITVAGLLTGKDMSEQLMGKALGDELIFPENTLRAGEDMFLDDMTTEELSRLLGVPVRPGRNDGAELIRALLGVE